MVFFWFLWASDGAAKLLRDAAEKLEKVEMFKADADAPVLLASMVRNILQSHDTY